MNEETIIIPRRLALRILSEAQNHKPSRIGGVVAADSSGPAIFLPIRNAAPNTETTLHHSGDDVFTAKMGIDGRGMTLWAYVDSHPNSEAVPTMQDFLGSPFPESLRLVVSLNTKGVLEMRAWERMEAQLRERVLKVRD